MSGRTLLRLASVVVVTGMVTIASGTAVNAQAGRNAAEDTLAQRSQEATTAREHAILAREYRQRAESLERTARAHEADAAKRSARPRFPHESKFPAHIRNTGERQHQLAVQARRAAQEAYARADHHVRLAVEGQLAE